MQILEYGQAQARTLLFLPCTAEPVWAFAQTVALLSKQWHVFQVVYDGHDPKDPGDFTSVEQTVDEVTAALKRRGVTRLGAAYGCSLGGACLTRLLALGQLPIGRAIIDGGITPYQRPFFVRKLTLARDLLVRQQLRAAAAACCDGDEAHLLVRRRREEGPPGQYPLYQALFPPHPHPRHPEDGPRGAGYGPPRGVLPVCGEIFAWAHGTGGLTHENDRTERRRC